MRVHLSFAARLLAARAGAELSTLSLASIGRVRITLPDGRSVVVIARDELEQWDEERARATLTEALTDPFSRRALERLADDMLCLATDIDGVAGALAGHIAAGRVLVLREPDADAGALADAGDPAWDDLPFLDDLRPTDGGDGGGDDAPTTPVPGEDPRVRTWHATLVLDDGSPLADETVRATPPAAAEREVVTDGAGGLAIGELGTPGNGRLVLRPQHPPRCGGGMGFVASQWTVPFPFDAPAVVDVPIEPPQVVVVTRPNIARIEPDSLQFARDASLLVPLDPARSHLGALATAIAHLGDRGDVQLMVVGHTSADGDAQANDALALRRAQCVQALLDGSRDAWVQLATSHGTPADVQRLLAYLAETHRWPTNPGRTDGVVDGGYAEAIAAFQQRYDDIYDAMLDVDGVCGEETLGALFDCQSYELHELVAALGASTANLRYASPSSMGAGAQVLAHPALAESGSAAGQRRVDLLLLPSSLAWRDHHGIALLYDVARIETLPLRPVALGRGDLVLRLVDHYGHVLADTEYVIETEADRREGTSDGEGMVVERGLGGELVRLTCGAARCVVVDTRYAERGGARRARPAAADLPPEDEDLLFEEDEPDDDDDVTDDPPDDDAEPDDDWLEHVDDDDDGIDDDGIDEWPMHDEEGPAP